VTGKIKEVEGHFRGRSVRILANILSNNIELIRKEGGLAEREGVTGNNMGPNRVVRTNTVPDKKLHRNGTTK